MGDPSNIVVSWVLCDDDPVAPGTQIYPPLEWGVYKPVFYYALVDDQQGDDDVVNVDVDVWHPEGSPPPYDANDYLKYELTLTRYANFFGAQNPWAGAFEEWFADEWFDYAYAAGVIEDYNIGINPDTGYKYTIGEICELIDQESVGFWAVCGWIHYEQPAGTYPVEIVAVDNQSNISTLDYSFYYIPVSMVEFDFTSINFGKVMVNTTQEIDGDRDWNDYGPFAAGFDASGEVKLPSPQQASVRNIGNVWSLITVEASNLYQNGLPLPSDTGWNVKYDACLSDPGFGNFKTIFYPLETATLNRTLCLSELQKLDFSLKFMKYGQTGEWTGTFTLGSVCTGFPWIIDG
jgi:hypothetical protein